ncbi:MAG TPA: DNA-directed RNA polymerase subunit omega [Saprospiraceae bacterium]|nr:DNA-directed RNA polymerase subunit omega [Saprospiraceae bacterium]HHH55134.1 DNA-directed RNA polymerase subunit omega [Bacteroidota bacterium]
MDIKSKAIGKDPNIYPRDINEFLQKNNIDNIYQVLAIIDKRSKYLTSKLKEELKGKLEDFSMNHDVIEEVLENREQIEITKFYEKLPNPALIAMFEFLEDKLGWEYRDKEGNTIER